MKPLLLKMTAFQSYLNETTIDLERLAKQGIFLISGNTGCGKTSIFDAISYALFERLPGGQRDISGIRTITASEEIVTEVSFTFQEGDQKYRVTRRPSQHVRSARSVRDLPASVSLEYLSQEGKRIDSKTAADSKILEIVGLNAEQFFQTTLLSQGAFAKVLNCKTEDRIKIFRTLFQTQKYDDFTNIIAMKANQLEIENRENRNLINSLYDNCQVLPEDEEEKSLIIKDDLRKNRLEELEKKYKDRYHDIVSLKEIKEKRKNLLDDTFKKIQEIQRDQESLTEKIEEIKSLKEDITSTTDDIEKRKEEYGDIAINDLKISRLEDLLPKYKELSEDEEKEKVLARSIKDTDLKIDKVDEDIKNNRDKKIKKEQNIKELEIKVDSLSNISEELIKEKSNYEVLQSKQKRVNEALEEYKKLQEVTANDALLKEKHLRCYKDYLDATSKYYESMCSVIVTEKLEEGKPCPVCGSISHPSIHKTTSDEITKEQLQEKRNESEKAKNEYEENNLELNRLVISIGDHLKDIKEDATFKEAKDLYTDIAIKTNKSHNKVNKLKSEYDSCLKLQKDLKVARDSLTIFDKEYDEYLKTENQLKVSLASYKAIRDSLLQIIDKKKCELGSLTYQQLLKSISTLKEKRDDFNSFIEEKEEERVKLRSSLDKAKAIRDSLKDRIEGCDISSLEYSQEEYDRLKQEIDELSLEEKEMYSLISSIKKNIDLFDKAVKKNEKIESLYNRYRELKYLFSANKDADLKKSINLSRGISLETYVLSHYLDEVLSRANERLKDMTSSLLLKRRDKVSDVIKSGLDIDVYDPINNIPRNTTTLSGGETFMASLSLALGLSDYVRETLGGIDIDTLFIDEGFGSLDKESLDRVISTICILSERSNITIGLISHVEELKNRFDCKLLVSKDENNCSKVILKD